METWVINWFTLPANMDSGPYLTDCYDLDKTLYMNTLSTVPGPN